MADLLDLPAEIIVRILCYLDLADLASAIQVNSTLRTYFKTFQILQYRFALQAAGVEDNPHSDLVVAERLERLKSQEEGWAQFRFDFRKRIPVRHVPSGIYDMTGGIYLLGDASKRTLHYCTLPSKADDAAEWKRINIDRRLVDMGLSIYEHDLIAIVTTTPHQTHLGLSVIEILLLQFSTGKPHPLARQPVLHVTESRWPRPAIGIEIVGDHLALVTNYFLHHDRPDDHFYIFEWKTGTLKMDVSADNHTYSGIVFLSPSLVLLPNTREKTLDVWSIPDAPLPSSAAPTTTTTPGQPPALPAPPPRPFLALSLPPIAHSQLLLTLSCRGEPNPTLSGTTPFSRHPFHPAPNDALVIFNMRLQHLGFARGSTFSMFVKRSALLEWAGDALARIERRRRRKERRRERERERERETERESRERDRGVMQAVGEREAGETERWEDPSVSGEEVETEGETEDEEDEEGDEDGTWPGHIRWDLPHGMMLVALDAHGQPIPIPVRPPPHAEVCVPWEDWGPPVTRLFDAEDMPTRWITTSAGERCVVSSEDAAGMGLQEMDVEEEETERPPLKVLDFNYLRVRRAMAQLQREMDEGDGGLEGIPEPGARMKEMLAGDVIVDRGPSGGRTQREVVTAPSVIQHEAFEEPVQTALPYVSLACWPPRGERFDFAGVLMDEERLLGLRTDEEDAIVEIEVMHMGSGVDNQSGRDGSQMQADKVPEEEKAGETHPWYGVEQTVY